MIDYLQTTNFHLKIMNVRSESARIAFVCSVRNSSRA